MRKSNDFGRSSDSDDDADIGSENPFMCEICKSANNSNAVFKMREHMDAHTLKNHSTVCIGCYDVFESEERLFEHLEAEKHETPLYCRQCRGIFLDCADIGHQCEEKASDTEEDSVSMKQENLSSDDEDEALTESCGNPFLCEICDSVDIESHAVFKERTDLALHTFKNHPSTCIGCFENFRTPGDLKKHVMAERHGLPCCHVCWRLFLDKSRFLDHSCQTAFIAEDEYRDKRNRTFKMEPQSEGSEDEETTVKMEPRSEDEELQFLFSCNHSSNDESEPDDKLEGDLSCMHCNAEGLVNTQDLREHTCKLHPLVCIVCFEGFDEEPSLRKHQNAMLHNVWKCARCDKYFIKLTMYRKHVTINHPDDCPLKCPDCDVRVFRKEELLAHQRKMHRDMRSGTRKKLKRDWRLFPSMCNICLKSFMTSYSLMLHMFQEHNEPGQTHVYKCEGCQLGFGRGTAFELHLKGEHADDMDYLNEAKSLLESTLKKSLNCEGCGQLCSSYGRLQMHILSKHPELRPHKCNICDAGYPEEGDVRVHIRIEHEGPAYCVCPVCGFLGKEIRSLERHLAKRHGYKGMPMVYCFVHKKGFMTAADYRRHSQTEHVDPENCVPIPKTGFPCHICGREFGKALSLKYHVAKVHLYSGERLMCDVCGRTFKDSIGLNFHKVKHTDTYKCKICNKAFELQKHLERHQVVHSGEKPFECELCGLKVSQRSSLQRHVKVVHADGKPMKLLKPRRTRGPKHESKVNTARSEEHVPSEEQKVPSGGNADNCRGGRKRRKCSESSSDPVSQEETLPKRQRGRPRRNNVNTDDRLINDGAGTNIPKSGRPRNAKDKAAAQVQAIIDGVAGPVLDDNEDLLLDECDDDS